MSELKRRFKKAGDAVEIKGIDAMTVTSASANKHTDRGGKEVTGSTTYTLTAPVACYRRTWTYTESVDGSVSLMLEPEDEEISFDAVFLGDAVDARTGDALTDALIAELQARYPDSVKNKADARRKIDACLALVLGVSLPDEEKSGNSDVKIKVK